MTSVRTVRPSHRFNIRLDRSENVDPKDLSDAVRRRVSATIYNRGRMYYLEGRVGDVTADGKTIEASVAGTAEYRVRIIAGDEPVITCNCPFGGICKHAVAVALKASEGSAGDGGSGPDIGTEIEDLARLSARVRLKAERSALRKRGDALLTEIGRRDPAERETHLRRRRSIAILEGTPLVEPFLEAWTGLIGELEADGAADIVSELLETEPERGLEAIARGRFTRDDAELLLARLPTAGDTIASDMAIRARVHLLGSLGRVDEVLEILGADAPVEAIEEGCSHLAASGRGDVFLPLVHGALPGRTPREQRALHLMAAGLETTDEGRIEHLGRCLELRVDREVMGRLVDVSPGEAVQTALSLAPETQVLLAEILIEKGERDGLVELAMGSDDVDMVEWIAEEADPGIALAEHLTDLLMTSRGRDIFWRIRRRLEDISGEPGLPAMIERLRERYPGRPGLKRLLDDFE